MMTSRRCGEGRDGWTVGVEVWQERVEHGDGLGWCDEVLSDGCVMQWCDGVDEERSDERRLTLVTIERL